MVDKYKNRKMMKMKETMKNKDHRFQEVLMNKNNRNEAKMIIKTTK